MMTRYLLHRSILTLVCTLPLTLFGQVWFYAVHSPDNDAGMVGRMFLEDGSESDAVPVTIDDVQVDGCTGMALHPISGAVYVVAKAGSTFHLATLDVSTGILSTIATMDEKFAGLAFDNDGTLYGITGDGSNTPETLYAIDTGTAALTLVAQPGTGDDGEALAYNTDNGLLYRYGGGNVFQSIDPADGTVTDIFLNGTQVANWAHALAYLNGSFIFTAGSNYYQVSLSGTVLPIGILSAEPGYKGLVNTALVGVRERMIEAPELFPNPASDMITISVPAGGMDHVRVFDASGALVSEVPLNGGTRYTHDVQHLAAGLYTVEVLSGHTSRTASFSVLR
ncbi:MAG: T9SS type A sorting domain-containing protein [Flavobacteriales bacterium]